MNHVNLHNKDILLFPFMGELGIIIIIIIKIFLHNLAI